MKSKVTSHDLIEEVTMSETGNLIIHVPQGKITIKADSEVSTIQFRSIDTSSRAMQREISISVIDLNNERLPREFHIALITGASQ